MSKKTITIFTQACKWSHSDQFKIEYNTSECKTSEYALYITLNAQLVEVDETIVDDEKLTIAHIDYLRGLKDQVKAKAQLDIQSLDDQINNLLCLENKGAA